MRADKVLKSIVARAGLSDSQASKRIGKSTSYFATIFYRKCAPKTDVFASICDSFGYDLIARDRDDGFEFTIDPSD